MYYEHLLIFSAVCVATFLLITYLLPRFLLLVYKRAILITGFGEGPIPINALYTEPQAIFADPFNLPPSAPKVATSGVNRDTLLVLGWLDLGKGAQILHVPDFSDRYYSVQFTNPSKNTNFAYVGTRTTGTKTGDYLISGPGWEGVVPPGMKHVSSPNNSVLVIGRALVYSDSDLSVAYNFAKQIQLTPLNQ